MLQALRDYIKVAVDIEREVVAGGGVMHADCEQALLESGSRQEDVWGANWYLDSGEVAFESLINIRPARGNSSMTVQDPDIRIRLRQIMNRVIPYHGTAG